MFMAPRSHDASKGRQYCQPKLATQLRLEATSFSSRSKALVHRGAGRFGESGGAGGRLLISDWRRESRVLASPGGKNMGAVAELVEFYA